MQRLAVEARTARTRMVIAATANRLFAARGYDAVTVEDVARAAGVSKQTVFNHFGRKEELVFARSAEVRDTLVAAVRDRAAGESVLAAFRAAETRFWHAVAELSGDDDEPGMFHVVTQSPALTAYAHVSGATMIQELSAALRETTGVGDEDTRPDVVASALAAAHGAIFERVRRRVVGGERVAAAVPGALAAAAPAFELLQAGLGADWTA
ncbi:MAG TPA: helix-turn-helix domain-containing protein [Solirubrobacteraceae bacterium]|nr:helix-turn-helix domain-containing protein [Solirubrobacteraceae bacterium]